MKIVRVFGLAVAIDNVSTACFNVSNEKTTIDIDRVAFISC